VNQMERILVVIDMQNFFITGQLGTHEAKAIVPAVAEKIKNFDGAVYVTQDINPFIDENSPDFAIYPPIAAALPENAVYIHKNTTGCIELSQAISAEYSHLNAFSPDGKPLLEIVFCGVCTNVCVISNLLILKAFLPKVKYAVDASCCAGFTPELHKAALDVMQSNRIEIIVNAL